jgi:transcriptional regulator with XRE-family HTH domain
MEALGSAIRARRAKLGLTQEELADRMAALGDENIRQSDISRIESGQVQLPRYERLVCLAQALEMTLAELFTLAGWTEERWVTEQSRNDREAPDRPKQGRAEGDPEDAPVETQSRQAYVQDQHSES